MVMCMALDGNKMADLQHKMSENTVTCEIIDNREGGGIGNACTRIRIQRMLTMVTWLYLSLWIVKFHYTSIRSGLDSEGLGAPLAESPEVLNPKEESSSFFERTCRCITDWPCKIFLQPVHSVNALLDRASAIECYITSPSRTASPYKSSTTNPKKFRQVQSGC